MIGGKLRISPALPEAWNGLKYTLMWKGQKLAVTVSADSVEVQNVTGGDEVTIEIWGNEYSFTDSVTVTK